MKSSRTKWLLFLGMGVLAMLLHREQQRGTFEPFDRRHREFLKANPGAREWPSLADGPQVVLARMDDPDLPPSQRTFDAWPPLPEEWRVVFQHLKDYQPKAVAVALPVHVDSPTPGFQEAASALPGLSVGVSAANSHLSDTAPLVLPPGVPVLRVQGPVESLPEFDRITPSGLTAAQAVTDVDLGQKVAVDGDWCRVPLLARVGKQVVPTLALQSLLVWSGTAFEDITAQPGTAIRGPRGFVIPIDDEGCFRYYLPLASPAAFVAADEFLFPREQADKLYPAGTPERDALDKVKGSLVWIGADDKNARLLKLPDGNTASPADLITRALAAIQTGRFIRPLEPNWQAGPLVLSMLFGWWITGWKRRNLWKGVFFGGIALVGLSLLAFQTSHTWVPLAPSFIELAAGFAAGLLFPRAPAPVPVIVPSQSTK